MEGLLDRIAALVTGRRRLMLAGVGLLAGLAALALPGIEADPSPEDLVAGHEDAGTASALMRAHFGDTDQVVLLLVEADDVLTPGVLSWVHRAARHFESQPFVRRVDSITDTPIAIRRHGPAAEETEELTLDQLEEEGTIDSEEPPEDVLDALGALVRAEPGRFPAGLASLSESLDDIGHGVPVEGDEATAEEAAGLREGLADSPLVEGRLVSADRRVTAVALWLADGVETQEQVTSAVTAVNAWLARVGPPPGARLHTAGLPHARSSIVDHMERDQRVLVPLTLLVCMVLLYAAFRWWPAAVLPVVAVGVTALLVVGGMALAGEPLNVLNNIIPPLLIIIGVSDSIHLIARYRDELSRGADRLTAARVTVRSMAVACLLTSLTTAVGLGSLVVSETPMLRRFAVIAAIGVMLAYVVTIAFLPPAMTAFKPPRIPKRSAEQRSDGLERLVVALTRAVLRRPWTVIAAAMILLCASGASIGLVKVDTALLDQFEPGDPVYDSTRLVERSLDGIRPLEIVLSAADAGELTRPETLREIDEVARWLRAQEVVLRVTTAGDYLHELWYLIADDPAVRSAGFVSQEQVDALALLLSKREPDPLAGYLSSDGRTGRLEVRLRDEGARAIMATVEEARSRLSQSVGRRGVTISMTGDGYTGSLGLLSVTEDLLSSLTVAVVVIFGMLAVLFRSPRLGLLSIPPNGLPLVTTVGWMVLRGIPLNIATAIIFSISIGLAVDGTIHVLARFQEERGSGHDVDASLLRAAAGTGRAIAISSVTLMLGFSVLLLSSFVPVRYFAELIAVTVGSCLVATLVLQPALLKVGAKRDRQISPR